MQHEVIINGYDKFHKGKYLLRIIPYGSKLIHVCKLNWVKEKTWFVYASDLHKILSIERNNTHRVLEILYDLHPWEYSFAIHEFREYDDNGKSYGADCPNHYSTTVIRYSNFMNLLGRFAEDKTNLWNFYRARKLYRFMNKYYFDNLQDTDKRFR